MEKIELTFEQLKDLLVRAGKHGFNSYETHEAGLEVYDPETDARWIILKFLSNKRKLKVEGHN